MEVNYEHDEEPEAGYAPDRRNERCHRQQPVSYCKHYDFNKRTDHFPSVKSCKIRIWRYLIMNMKKNLMKSMRELGEMAAVIGHM